MYKKWLKIAIKISETNVKMDRIACPTCGENSIDYLYVGIPKGPEIYRIIFPLAILVGSMSTLDLVWLIQDCALGLLIIPNMIALVVLSPQVRQLTKEFFNPQNGYVPNLKTKE